MPCEHKTVVYLGLFIRVWGHFITDTMRLIWFLKSKYFRENFYDCELVYLPAKNFKLEGNYRRMFEILGVNISNMKPVTRLTKYDKVILPDECFFISKEGIRTFTPEYITLIDAIRNYASEHSYPCPSRKVYYSYSGYRNCVAVGEDKLEKYFASKGYTIIHPEKLSLDEQLNLLIGCESFASTVGSCSHNMLFLRDDTEVILIPRANYLASYQTVIDQVHRMRINYVDSSFSIFSGKYPYATPFLFFISSNLRKFFHDEDTESIVDVKDFKKYFRISSGCSMSKIVAYADNPNTYRYYSVVAADYFSKLFASIWIVRLKKWLKTIPAIRKIFGKPPK